MYRTIYTALAIAAAAATPALAQQQNPQQNPQQFQQQDQRQFQQQGQQQFQRGQTQPFNDQQIRNFFQNAEQQITQAVRNNNLKNAMQFFGNNLAEQATFYVANQVYFNDRLIAAGTAALSEDTLSMLMGMAGTMHNTQNLSDYDLNIRVQDITYLPSQDAARVQTVFNEYTQISPQQQLSGYQQSASGYQQQGPWQSQNQMQGTGQRSAQGGQQWNPQQQQQQGFAQQVSSVEVDSQTECAHIVMLDQGNIQIGDSFCRAQTRINTDGQQAGQG